VSVHAISWALDQKVSPTGAKFVLVALANYADENGIAYPSQARLAEQTNQSERAVRGHLATLERQGFIKRTRRHSKSGARTSDIYEISYRQNLPLAESATGNKRQNLPAESAGEPKEEPKDTLSVARVRSLDDLTLDDALMAWWRLNAAGVDPVTMLEDLRLYCKSKGKRYKDYRAALMTWGKREQRRIDEKRTSKNGKPNTADRRREMLEGLKDAGRLEDFPLPAAGHNA
jgi:hypothetical protein